MTKICLSFLISQESYMIFVYGTHIEIKKIVSYHLHYKRKVTRVACKTYFTLFKLNITFYFKCYLHHNCSVNLNWNNTQLNSSAKPLHNVLSSAFWFVIFCFLAFLCRTSVQKWKKTWFCYVHRGIGEKEMSAKITKYIALAKIPECKESISPFSF